MVGETKFTPSACDGVRYSGTVTIRPFSFDERLEMYETYGLSDLPDADSPDRPKFYLKVAAKVGKMSHQFVTACDIVRLSDGHAYTWDEVYHDGELTSTVMEVCGQIMGKIRAGI